MNLRPPGYEPGELPLLHPAFGCRGRDLNPHGEEPHCVLSAVRLPGSATSALRQWPYPRFCSDPLFVSSAAPGLVGVTHPRRCRCDRTQPDFWSGPGPPALLPAALSPSLPHYCDSWWALTPPFHPLPAPLKGPLAGLLSVAVVVTGRLLLRCPGL